MHAVLLGAIFAIVLPTAALACTPPPNWTTDLQQQADDADLLQANFIYRGVIENPEVENSLPPLELTRMQIRRTELLWGTGEPEVVSISMAEGYYSACARGNLGPVTQFGGEPGWPQIRDGLGVTVIGRIGDEPFDLFILVDGAPDTEDTLRRFARNLLNQ